MKILEPLNYGKNVYIYIKDNEILRITDRALAISDDPKLKGAMVYKLGVYVGYNTVYIDPTRMLQYDEN